MPVHKCQNTQKALRLRETLSTVCICFLTVKEIFCWTEHQWFLVEYDFSQGTVICRYYVSNAFKPITMYFRWRVEKQIFLGWNFVRILMTDLTAAIVKCLARDYGMQLSHIFEIPSIQMKNLISKIKILGILNQKFWITRFFTPWTWNTRYFEGNT